MRPSAIALTISAAIFLAAPAAAKGKSNPAAVAMFNKAIQSSDIAGKGQPPFRLQATVRVSPGEALESDGMAIKFSTPSGTRYETLLKGYSQVEVIENGEDWVKSSTEYAPFPVAVIWRALGLKSVLLSGTGTPPSVSALLAKQPEQVTLGKPKRDKRTNDLCVDSKGRGSDANSLYCFDPGTGNLASVTLADWDLHFQYSDYQAFGAKDFPRTIRVSLENGQPFIDIQVTRIDATPTFDPNEFLPPPGSQEEPPAACGKEKPAKVTRAKLFKETMPVYPDSARRNYISGTVKYYAIIGKDGVPHSLWLLKSPSPALAIAALAALRQWRYQPTTLCGQDVSVDTILTVVFTL